MARRSGYRLLLATALLHLFADVAFAGGAVFCVGTNDHRAVELQHASVAVCQTADAFDVADAAAVLASTSDCEDTPLHCSPELVGSADDGSDIAPTVVALASQLSSPSPERALGGSVRTSISPPGLQLHRTTVLLL